MPSVFCKGYQLLQPLRLDLFLTPVFSFAEKENCVACIAKLGSESWRLRPCHLQVTGSHAEQGGMHCRQVHSVMAGLRQGGGSRVQMDGVVHFAGQPHLAEVRK